MKKDTYNPVFYVVGDRQQLLYLLRVQQASDGSAARNVSPECGKNIGQTGLQTF